MQIFSLKCPMGFICFLKKYNKIILDYLFNNSEIFKLTNAIFQIS